MTKKIRSSIEMVKVIESRIVEESGKVGSSEAGHCIDQKYGHYEIRNVILEKSLKRKGNKYVKK